MKKPEVLHDLLQFFFALLGRSDWSSPIALDTGDSLAPTVPMVPGTLMQLPGNVYGPARAAHYEVSESAAGRHEQVMCSSFADCGTLTMCSSPPAKRGFLDLNKGATPSSSFSSLSPLPALDPNSISRAQDAVGGMWERMSE